MAITIDGTTGIASVDASASTPSIRGADSNSGIFYAADAIKFSTGGTERFTITNTGFTGITQGITELDQWRITANFTASTSQDLTSNWERNDSSFEKIGTGMSESSGIFTFPSTGKWAIDYRSMCHDTDPSRYGGIIIYLTTNNSSYSNIAESFGGIFDKSNDNVHTAFSAYAIVDVTNTSTHKCKFWVGSQNEVLFNGASDGQRTGVTFTRLGDT